MTYFLLAEQLNRFAGFGIGLVRLELIFYKYCYYNHIINVLYELGLRNMFAGACGSQGALESPLPILVISDNSR